MLGNIIYVGLVTIAQKRLDWMLGYSSVMHMGYIFLGIASGNFARHQRRRRPDVRARPFDRPALRHRRRTAATHRHACCSTDLGGLGKGHAAGPRSPSDSAAFASIGLPGFANFAGEVMVFFGAFRHGANLTAFTIFQIATVLALWGVVISAVYMLRAYRAVFMGAMA